MRVLTYLESCQKWFAPLDEICEALSNKESCGFIPYPLLQYMVVTRPDLAFYVENFDTHVSFP